MKYISFTLITLWATWMLVTNGDLKPSDNYFLWILGVLSIMYSVINLVVFYVDARKNGL
jgi:predicted outer membrane lipoprotein